MAARKLNASSKVVSNGAAVGANTANAAKTGFFLFKPTTLIGIIVLIGVAVVVLNLTRGPVQVPKFQYENNSIPQAFAALRSINGTIETQDVAKLIQARLANESSLTVLYAGNTSLQASLVSVQSPVLITDEISGSSQKFAINVTSVTGIGMVDLVYANTTNGTFTCTNLNDGALRNGDYQAALFGNHSTSCRRTNQIAGLNFAQLAEFNFSQLAQDGVALKYNQVYQSRYQGIPCTFVSGTAKVPGVNNTGSFQMCISDTNYIPLSYSAVFTGSQKSFVVTENETSIVNSSSLAAVDSLPGPVVT